MTGWSETPLSLTFSHFPDDMGSPNCLKFLCCRAVGPLFSHHHFPTNACVTPERRLGGVWKWMDGQTRKLSAIWRVINQFSQTFHTCIFHWSSNPCLRVWCPDSELTVAALSAVPSWCRYQPDRRQGVTSGVTSCVTKYCIIFYMI